MQAGSGGGSTFATTSPVSPYTGLVLRERPAFWHHGVSLPQHQARLESLLTALRNLAGRGLTAEVVLAHLHHRRIVPLMERSLRISEMTEAADPVALARSWTLQSPLLREYAATRARSAIDSKSARNDGSLWDLEMLPTGRLVSGVLDFVFRFCQFPGLLTHFDVSPAAGARKRREVRAAHSPLSRARSRGAAVRAGAGGTQEGARDAASEASRAEE
jgi:hypothetical protein